MTHNLFIMYTCWPPYVNKIPGLFPCLVCYHIEPKTKWPTFYRRHFQIYFLNENVYVVLQMSLKFIPWDYIANTRSCMGADQVTSQYLKQWWSGSLTPICVRRPQYISIYTYGNIYKSIYVMWIRVKHQIFPRATVKWSKKSSLNNFRKSKTIYEAMYKISSVNLPLLIWFSVGQIWSSRDKMMVKRVITHDKVDIIALWPISPTLCAAKSLDSLHRGSLTQWPQRDAA